MVQNLQAELAHRHPGRARVCLIGRTRLAKQLDQRERVLRFEDKVGDTRVQTLKFTLRPAPVLQLLLLPGGTRWLQCTLHHVHQAATVHHVPVH